MDGLIEVKISEHEIQNKSGVCNDRWVIFRRSLYDLSAKKRQQIKQFMLWIVLVTEVKITV